MPGGRPPLPIGTYGEIWVSPGPKPYKARARFRDADGVTRPVARFGETKDRAKRALRTALAERQQGIRAGTITRDTSVADLADLWLAREQPWSVATRETYEGVVKRQVKTVLAGVKLREVRLGVVNKALEAVMATSGNGAAKTTRTVLAGMFELAISHDAMQANPARGTVRITGRSDRDKRALTSEEIDDLCDRLRGDSQALELDLPDLVEFMLGTGARIGEVCAARDDESLDLDVGTWEINGTVVRKTGSGLFIQPRPKTAAGWRVLALPSYVVELAKRRRNEVRFSTDERVLFGSPRAHALRDKSNTAGDLRAVLDRLDYGWVHSHTFRRTVATRLDAAGMSARQIADQLGHAKPSMTQDNYMGRRVVSAEAARILDR